MKKTVTNDQPVALITGSSKGIGLATARALSDLGFSIILNGRENSDHLKEAVDTLQSQGHQVLSLPFNIADIASHRKALDSVLEHYGRIDCLINNAGISVKNRGDLLDISPSSFDEQISVNLRAHFFLTQLIAKWMVEHPSSSFRSIINTSSSNAEAAALERGEYSIAKSGISMMTKLFALRLAKHGINVYEIRPGLISTDMTAVAQKQYNRRIEAGFSPINRWGKPDDVAKVITSLASGEWPFVTGESIHVDGGLLIPTY